MVQLEKHPDSELKLLTVKEAAGQLSCSPANVYSLIEQGALPVVRVGREKGYRVDLRDLDAFVNDRKFRYRPAATALPRPKLKHLRT